MPDATSLITASRSRSISRRFAIEALVAGLATVGAVIARIGVEHIVGGVAPFVLTFPAVMIATLASGGRAGVIAAVSCQLLTIRYVFPNWIAPHGGVSTDLANVILSTLALAGTIWATESYRRTVAILRSRCEHQVHTLSLLHAEMEHRTKNNFQIAAGLLAHQSLSSLEPGLAQELAKAASRLEAIASVYQDLSMQMEAGKPVDLAAHLERVVSILRSGATPEHVLLRYRAEHALVSNEVAVVAGLIVNEWVTNALKHAFGEEPGSIAVDVVKRAGSVRITVHDDGGTGRAESSGQGRGGSLMIALAEAVQATITVSHQGGTRCTLAVPIGAA